MLCGCCVLVGLVSSFTTGAIIQRTKKFRLMMRISCFGCAFIAFLAIWTFKVATDSALICVNIISIGIVMVPIIPISINFSSELTFPIEPTVVTGTLMMVG